MQGYIKTYRKILDNPIVTKDTDYFSVWNYLLLKATHTKKEMLFGGKPIELYPGQLITGRKSIASFWGISESKVQRILKLFENSHLIEQQTNSCHRLITIIMWVNYQQNEQQNEQQMNNNRTTNEQQMNTNKNGKNGKNGEDYIKGKEETSYANFIDFFNGITGRKFKYSDKKAQRQYTYLVKEGYKREDFEKVIRNAYTDNYHRETGFKYLTPEFITRTDKWDRYLAMGDKVRLKPVVNEVGEEEKQRKFDETLKVLGF